jgi:hypothetical protein
MRLAADWSDKTPEDFSPVDVGEYGTGYFSARLAESGGLSAELLRRVRQTGKVLALAPKGEDAERVKAFEVGGDFQFGHTLLLKRLEEVKGNNLEGCLLIQDLSAHPSRSDPPPGVSFFVTREGVYHFVLLEDLCLDRLSDALETAVGFHIVACLTREPVRADLVGSGEQSDALVRKMASNAVEAYTNIYHGESWLIWTDRGPSR